MNTDTDRNTVANTDTNTDLNYKSKQKNAILDGCSTVDSKLDYDGIGWYSMVLHGIRWYFAIEQYSLVFNGIAWSTMVLQAITWYLMVFNNIRFPKISP